MKCPQAPGTAPATQLQCSVFAKGRGWGGGGSLCRACLFREGPWKCGLILETTWGLLEWNQMVLLCLRSGNMGRQMRDWDAGFMIQPSLRLSGLCACYLEHCQVLAMLWGKLIKHLFWEKERRRDGGGREERKRGNYRLQPWNPRNPFQPFLPACSQLRYLPASSSSFRILAFSLGVKVGSGGNIN